MNYAIFSHRFPPLIGGVEIFTENLANELVSQGNQVHVITSQIDDSPSLETHGNLRIWRLPSYGFFNGRMPVPKKSQAAKKLWDQLDQYSFDRVLVNTRLFLHSLDGCKFAKQRGLPLVVLDHGSAYLSFGNPALDTAIKAYEHLLMARIKHFKPTFAGISKASTEWLRTFGVDTNLVITNAIDIKAFAGKASSRSFKDELELPDDSRIVAFIGRLTPEKGAVKLAKAAMLCDKTTHIVMAGTGPDKTAIEELGCDRVHLLGRLNHPDAAALLKQSSLFCLPSRSEGCCTSLLECVACDSIPLMTRVGGTSEVFDDNELLLLPDTEPSTIADGIKRCLAIGDDMKAELSSSMKARVSTDMSWASVCRQLEHAFCSCNNIGIDKMPTAPRTITD